MRVVVLGAGFGGLELTTRLSDEFGDDVDVVLIDQTRRVRLRVLEARRDVRAGDAPSAVHHPYRDIVKPGVRFVQADDHGRSTRPPSGSRPTPAPFDADVLVVALGADLDPAATPGLVEGGHEFYTVAGAFALRDVLADFDGGRVIVGVTSTPFKCPPAPSETALLMHDHLTERGLRDRVGDRARHAAAACPIPPSPAASEALLAAFAERGIDWHPRDGSCARSTPTASVAVLGDGTRDALRPLPRRARCTGRRRSCASRA